MDIFESFKHTRYIARRAAVSMKKKYTYAGDYYFHCVFHCLWSFLAKVHPRYCVCVTRRRVLRLRPAAFFFLIYFNAFLINISFLEFFFPSVSSTRCAPIDASVELARTRWEVKKIKNKKKTLREQLDEIYSALVYADL